MTDDQWKALGKMWSDQKHKVQTSMFLEIMAQLYNLTCC